MDETIVAAVTRMQIAAWLPAAMRSVADGAMTCRLFESRPLGGHKVLTDASMPSWHTS